MIREYTELNKIESSDSRVVAKVKELFKENPDVYAVNIKVTPKADKVELHFNGSGRCRCVPFDDEPVAPAGQNKPKDLGTKEVTLDEAKAVFGDVDVKRYKEYGRSFLRRVMFD